MMRTELLRALNAQRAVSERTLPLSAELEYLDPRGGYQPGDVPDLPLCDQTPCRDTRVRDAATGVAVSLCVLASIVVWCGIGMFLAWMVSYWRQ